MRWVLAYFGFSSRFSWQRQVVWVVEGPSKTKLSTGTPHLHIFEFEQVGEMVDPLIALGPYKSIIGVLVRDFILLKYKKWNGKEDNEWMVLESEKDAIWERLKGHFTFPPSYDV